MSRAIAKVWDEEAATRGAAGMFQDALAEGPQVVLLRDGREVIVASRDAFERPRLTPQEYVRLNKLRRPDPDPFDEAMQQARSEVGDVMGYNR